MTKATHKATIKRLNKVAQDLKTLDHPALAMRVAGLANEVFLAMKRREYGGTYIQGAQAEVVFIDEPR